MSQIAALGTSYQGSVARIHSHGPAGGVIASLVDGTTGALVRVIARYDVVRERIDVGDAIRVRGTPEDNPLYGLQFRASECSRVLPSGSGAINLLARHPRFAFIGPRRAARLGRLLDKAGELGDWVPETLSLVRAGISHGLAARCLETWRDYAREVELTGVCVRLGVSEAAACRLSHLWSDPAKHVSTNPYCLAGVAGWALVDRAGLEAGFASDSPSRLSAACVAAFFPRAKRVGWAMHVEEHKRVVARLLGSSPLAPLAIQIGMNSGGLYAVAHGIVQDAGAAAITSALLAVIRQPSNARLPQRVQIHVLDGLRVSEGMRMSAALLPEALHIVPDNAFPGFEHLCASLADVSRGVAAECIDAARTGVVVHFSDVLEPHVLNRLLNDPVISRTAKLVLTGFSAGPVLRDSLFTPMLKSKAFDTIWLAHGSEPGVDAMEPNDTADYLPRGSMFVRINAADWSEAKEEALAAYREATELRLHRTVVIGETEAVCRIVNQELHNEFVAGSAQADSKGSPTPKMRVGRYRDVQFGEPLRVIATDIREGLIRGCRVSQPGRGQERSIDLAYACTPKTSAFFPVQTVIVIEMNRKPTGFWARVFALAESCVVVVSVLGANTSKATPASSRLCEASPFQKLIFEELRHEG